MAAFDAEEAAIAAANDTEFGLVAYVYTRDLKRASGSWRVWRRAWWGSTRAGSNPAAPFRRGQAVRLGREGGPEGIAEYLEIKYVAMNL